MHTHDVVSSVPGPIPDLARRADEVSAGARRFGFISATGFVALSVAYAIPLAIGLATLASSGVHFPIMYVSHQDEIANLPWVSSLLTFQWPSVPYALDMLAWDFFFPISVLLAAAAFGGTRLTDTIRVLLLLSGTLSLVGLLGPAVDNMNVRSIGIVGYAVVFPIAVVLLARLFRTRTQVAAQP